MTADEVTETALALADMAYSWKGKAPFRMEIPALSVDAGKRVVLFGESGSGKSTLLGLICGVLAPDSGRIAVSGVDLTAMGSRARDRFRAGHIGVIFQQFNLLPFSTPLDNILLPLRFSRTRRQKLSDPKAEAFRLTDALDLPRTLVAGARASDLSVGQQQRVAVARALIGRPALILADEPTSSLDAGAQTAFLDLLFERVAEARSSLLMVTHDDRLASRFDQVLRFPDIAHVTREASV